MKMKISNYFNAHKKEYSDYMSMYDSTVYGYCLSNTKNRRKLIKDITFKGRYTYSNGWLYGGTIRRFIDRGYYLSNKSRKVEDYRRRISNYYFYKG